MANPESTLADEVAFLFREQTEVESVTQREYGTATISVAVVTYADTRKNSNDTTRYRQTVLFLEDAELDLPEFSLSPKPKGLLSVAMKLIGDFGTIQFEDSPAFSEKYVLQGWVVEATRVFFNRSIREHFAERPWMERSREAAFDRGLPQKPRLQRRRNRRVRG